MIRSLRGFLFVSVLSLFAFVLTPLAGLVDRAAAALSFNTGTLEGVISSADLDAYGVRSVTIEQSYRAYRRWDTTAASK